MRYAGEHSSPLEITLLVLLICESIAKMSFPIIYSKVVIYSRVIRAYIVG